MRRTKFIALKIFTSKLHRRFFLFSSWFDLFNLLKEICTTLLRLPKSYHARARKRRNNSSCCTGSKFPHQLLQMRSKKHFIDFQASFITFRLYRIAVSYCLQKRKGVDAILWMITFCAKTATLSVFKSSQVSSKLSFCLKRIVHLPINILSTHKLQQVELL